MSLTKNVIYLNEIVLIYFGNNQRSYKLFGQINEIEQTKNKNEQKVSLITKLDETSWSFLCENQPTEAHVRVVFPCLESELASYSAIDNLDNSALSDMIIDPLNIIESSIHNESVNIRQYSLSHLDEEQRTIVHNTHAMCSDQNKPNIKLIEGPPGSGKSTMIQNLVLRLLRENEIERKPKILLCTKNDTAVDVIVKKLTEKNKKLSIVRYGVDKHIHPKILNYSINGLVKAEWEERQKNDFLRLSMKQRVSYNYSQICNKIIED